MIDFFYLQIFFKNYKELYFLVENFNKPLLKKKKFKFKNHLNINLYIYMYTHQNHIQFTNKFISNRNVYSNFNHFTFLNMKRFEYFFQNFSRNSKNFTFLDSDYSITYNLYKSSFSKNNLYRDKLFFFIKPKYFTYNNWIYYYSVFCKNNNVSLIFSVDYFYFKNFLKSFSKLSVVLVLLQPIDFYKVNADYYFYTNSNFYNFHKFFYINYLNSLYFTQLNNSKEIKKDVFLKNFSNFKKFYIG